MYLYIILKKPKIVEIISLPTNEDVKHKIETVYIHIMHICIPPAFHYIYVNTCSKVIPNQSFSLLLSSENKPHNGITSRIRSRQKMLCCNITVNLVQILLFEDVKRKLLSFGNSRVFSLYLIFRHVNGAK